MSEPYQFDSGSGSEHGALIEVTLLSAMVNACIPGQQSQNKSRFVQHMKLIRRTLAMILNAGRAQSSDSAADSQSASESEYDTTVTATVTVADTSTGTVDPLFKPTQYCHDAKHVDPEPNSGPRSSNTPCLPPGPMHRIDWSLLPDMLKSIFATIPHHLPAVVLNPTAADFGHDATQIVVMPFPKYGSVVRFIPPDRNYAPSLDWRIEIVALDEWKQVAHGGLTSSSVPLSDVASCTSSKLMYIGSIQACHIPKLLRKSEKLIHKAKRVTLNKRSAAAGSGLGHQKTPGFLSSVLRTALRHADSDECSDDSDDEEDGGGEEDQSTGGFTDVGQHTSVIPRETAWPLARQILMTAVQESASCEHLPYSVRDGMVACLYHLSCADLSLCLLQTSQTSTVNLTQLHLRSAAAFLQSIALHRSYGQATVEFIDVTACFVERCSSDISSALQELLQHYHQDQAAKFSLPDFKSDSTFDTTQLLGPQVSEFAVPEPPTSSLSQKEKLLLAQDCLGLLVSPPQIDLADHKQWTSAIAPLAEWANPNTIMAQKNIDNVAALTYILQEIEQFVFAGVFHFLSSGSDVDCVVTANICDALFTLCRHYVELRGRLWLDLKKRGIRISPVRRSRSVVVLWSECCLMDLACRSAFVSFRLFRTPLDPEMLQVLTISDDSLAGRAISCIKQYLAFHSTKPTIFELGVISGDTANFARSYFDEDRKLQDTHATVELKMRDNHASHWKLIETKRREYKALSADRYELEQQCDQLAHTSVGHKWCTKRNCHQCYEINQLQSSIERLSSKMKQTQKLPRALYQPLPRAADNAKVLLFLLFMPKPLRLLWQSLLHAQHFLISDSLCPQCNVKASGLSQWSQYYNDKLDDSLHDRKAQAQAQTVTERQPYNVTRFIFDTRKLPKETAVNRVTTIDSADYDDGVYYPDSLPILTTCMLSRKYVDPFKRVDVKQLFKLYSHSTLNKQLQQFVISLPRHLVAPDRTNQPLAVQTTRPHWMNQQQYVAFANLLSYPLQAATNLASAIQDCRLPLQNYDTHALIRQALYRVGPLHDNIDVRKVGVPRSKWRYALSASTGVPSDFARILAAKAAELRESPKRFSEAMILAEVATFMSQFEAVDSTDCNDDESDGCNENIVPRCIEVARSFCDIASAWATNRQLLIDKLDSQSKFSGDHSHMRCLFLQVAIIALDLPLHAGGCSAKDTRKLCKLTVQLFHALPLEDRSAAHQDALSATSEIKNICGLDTMALIDHNQARINSVFARQLRHMLPHIRNDPTMLTEALLSEVESAPSELKWEEPNNSTHCFTAWDEQSSTLYSINLRTGCVLVDGRPRRNLPNDIVHHALFQRTFGKRSFDVHATDDGVFITRRKVGNCIYHFSVHKNCLVVDEHDRSTDIKLRLLSPHDEWINSFPIRWKHSYSHWYVLHQNSIVLRGIHYLLRDVHMVLQVKDDHWNCYKCPNTQLLGKHDWSNFDLTTFDRFVIPVESGNSHSIDYVFQVLQVLTKMEKRKFIESYVDASNNVLFELPRLSLSFTLDVDSGVCTCSHEKLLLAQHQQLPDRLRGFTQYLILQERGIDDTTLLMPRLTYLLTPKALCYRANDIVDSIKLLISDDEMTSGCLKYHTYMLHPRSNVLKVPKADVGREGRLHLAALHAACDTLLPEPAIGMTGSEHAAELVRQCYSNRPLSAQCMRELQLIVQFCNWSPALALLCYDVDEYARQLQFLSTNNDDDAEAEAEVEEPFKFDKHAHTSRYLASCGQFVHLPCGFNTRRSLAADEERRILGHVHSGSMRAYRHAFMSPVCDHVAEEPSMSALASRGENILSDTEKCLGSWLEPAQEVSEIAPFPAGLNPKLANNAVQQRCYTVLERSWKLHQECAAKKLKSLIELKPTAHMHRALRAKLASLSSDVHDGINMLQSALMQLLSVSHTFGRVEHLAWKTLVHAGGAPVATVNDLLRFGVCIRNGSHGQFARHFNPFLSKEGIALAQRCCIVWMQLCVLDDRLQRCDRFVCERNYAHLQRELELHREWDPSSHPHWLAFEVEGRLQIRPEQFSVYSAITGAWKSGKATAPMVQLNMGLGKTRVILPMLLMDWYFQTESAEDIAIVFFLAPLLDEGYWYLHQYLCASVHNMLLVTAPFNRTADLDVENTRRLSQFFRCVKHLRAVLVLAPEHHLSLRLKLQDTNVKLKALAVDQMEVIEACQDVATLDEKSDLERDSDINVDSDDNCNAKQPQPTDLALISKLLTDVLSMRIRAYFDECDALMRHTNQLIYAVGIPDGISSGQARWDTIHAVLNAASTKEFAALAVDQLQIAVRRPAPSVCAYHGVRLVDLDKLKWQQCCEHILDSLAHETCSIRSLQWLRLLVHKCPEHHKPLQRYVTDSSVSASEVGLSELLSELSDEHADCIYMLRGLLAEGILSHCLSKRHGVNYGLDARRTKRLAVPYHASDAPTERTELAQPDVAITSTFLSYYHTGLNRHQVREVFDTLFDLGPAGQETTYRDWFNVSRYAMDDHTLFSSVHAIDLSNSEQFSLIVQYYRFNPHVIFFWLKTLVFPNDTKEYPSRLSANAWHLADTYSAAGFSGTNDTNDLMPLQVLPVDVSSAPQLGATNGMMLDYILRYSEELVYYVKPPATAADDDGKQQQWERILQTCIDGHFHALIDTGALLNGPSNVDIARVIVDLLVDNNPHELRGVTYYSRTDRAWMVQELDGRETHSAVSPIAERDTFVYFSQQHTRGVDKRLRKDAKAIVTIGPLLRKDALMQGAGRMRGFGSGQHIALLYCRDVASHIHRFAGDADNVQPLHVIQYVMEQTDQFLQNGLASWSQQGIHFVKTQCDSVSFISDENSDLKRMYAAKRSKRSVHEIVSQRCSAASNVVDAYRANIYDVDYIDQIEQRSKQLGSDAMRNAAEYGETLVLDNECERETEQEEEQEEETESQLPVRTPANEIDWEVAALANLNSLTVSDTPLSLAATQSGTSIAIPIHDFVTEWLVDKQFHDSSQSVSHIHWSKHVFLSNNFARVLRRDDAELASDNSQPDLGQSLNYARLADFFLCFPSGDILLLSERDHELLLEYMHQLHLLDHKHSVRAIIVEDHGVPFESSLAAQRHCKCVPTLVSLSFACDSFRVLKSATEDEKFVSIVDVPLAVPLDKNASGIGSGTPTMDTEYHVKLHSDVLVCLQLFNGQTNNFLNHDAVMCALSDLGPDDVKHNGAEQSLLNKHAIEAVRLIPRRRGLAFMLPESVLERLCADPRDVHRIVDNVQSNHTPVSQFNRLG
jgi:Protein of unknown function (DUF3638)/Protein of unknown function (DUF3645)